MKKVSKLYCYFIQRNEIFVGSRISKFLRPAQRYDDFKLIRITCRAACHGKTEHVIFVKFKKPSKTALVLKTAVVLIAGVTISGTPCPRHFIVPFGAEAPSELRSTIRPIAFSSNFRKNLSVKGLFKKMKFL